MSQLTETAKNQLRQAVINAINKAVSEGELPAGEAPEFTIEVPNDRAHGDFATNAAMVSARVFRKSPAVIAKAILDRLELEDTYASTAEIAGAGFINFRLSDNFYADIILDILKEKENFGRSDFGKGKSIDVEFVSANPTGPMHIGNARGGALGDCLASVLEAAGYDVTREFYINDAGNQINKFALSLEVRYLQIFDQSVEMPEDAYQGKDITEHAENFYKIYGDKYKDVSSDERRKALVEYALPLNIEGLERDLMKYRIKYDVWFHESTLHQNGAVEKVIELMKEKGHTYEKDGALWFKAEQFGADKDFVMVRSNGVPTYVVPDIAYHYNKLVTRNFDTAIDILGADHHGYVPRLKAALSALGVDPDRLEVILMQMVRLVRNGETIKASKRSGKAITLVTLLEEVPLDAARFFFNTREANTHFDFDLDLAVSENAQNPVYYVQYAHARICSILKNLAAEGITPKEPSPEDLVCLKAPEERELIRYLGDLPDVVITAAKTRNPALITHYSVELATLFHKFYNACRVKGAEGGLESARLSLCLCTRTVLENILAILKVDAPETM